MTNQGLKQKGKTTFLVDLSGANQIEGDDAVASLADFPSDAQFDAAVIELHPDDMNPIIEQLAVKGVKHLWIQHHCQSPKAVALAKEKERGTLGREDEHFDFSEYVGSAFEAVSDFFGFEGGASNVFLGDFSFFLACAWRVFWAVSRMGIQ